MPSTYPYLCNKMMHEFEHKVSELINKEHLLPTGGLVIVGLSGGADSVALLSALSASGYKCMAAHCNFGLRGDEADRDQQHAMTIARQLGAEWMCVKFDTKAYMQQHGVSAEMACRDLRYNWFRELMSETGAAAIAVAHHRDDNVETLLLNLMRGAGVHGLRGMKPRNGDVIRPMLECSRDEVLAYLSDKGLEYITDSSNLVNDVKRNRIRNIILPLINAELPGATEAMARSIDALRDNELIVDEARDKAQKQYMDGDRIDLKALFDDHPATAQALLFELLYPIGFNATLIRDIGSAFLVGNSGRRFNIGKKTALLDHGSLILNITNDSQSNELIIKLTDSSTLPPWLKMERITPAEFKPERNPNIMYMDATEADNGSNKWALRHWREGDRMIPFGMNGSRKLSDIFSDAKLSVAEKDKVWILTCNEKITWLAGIRASQLFKINRNTREIIKITYLPELV